MSAKDYNCTFRVPKTAQEVYHAAGNVAGWWMANAEGSTKAADDVFDIRLSETSWVSFRVTEAIPGRRLVWLVTDCLLDWLKDIKEWKDTTITFEITANDGGAQVSMTHAGITPDVECYESCRKGWDQYVGTSLVKLIMEGEGQPNMTKVGRV